MNIYIHLVPLLSLFFFSFFLFFFFFLTEIPSGLVGTVFANGLGDLGSIPGRVIPKTKKIWYFLSTQNYKVQIKAKVEQSRERSSAFPYTSV